MRTLMGLVAALLLTACSGAPTITTVAATTAPPVTPRVASVTPTSSTPTVWGDDEAGTYYLASVKEGNALTAKLNKILTGTDVRAMRSWCKRFVGVEDRLQRKLEAGLWTVKVRPIIDDVIENSAAARQWFQSCSKAKTMDAQLVLGPIPEPNPAAGQRARVTLGLPGT